MAGWGIDENGNLLDSLGMAEMPIVDNRVCSNSFEARNSDVVISKLKKYVFCAGILNGKFTVKLKVN